MLAEPDGPAVAVVLSLHGTRSTAEGEVRLSRLAGLAAEGVVVAFPQGLAPAGSGYQWDHRADTAFLAQLAGDLLQRHPTPDGRVCMTGMSGGARMSSLFAAARPETVRMVGAVAGLRAPDVAPLTRPVPILAFHGTSDRINPYAGSGTTRWDESVPESARRWAEANGHAGPPTETAVSPSLTRTTYGAEGEPGEVTLWTSKGAGHTWPGTRLGPFLRLILGRTSVEIDATERIWAFARAHAGDPYGGRTGPARSQTTSGRKRASVPPSAKRTWPWTNELCELNRNTTTLAISSGTARRPRGMGSTALPGPMAGSSRQGRQHGRLGRAGRHRVDAHPLRSPRLGPAADTAGQGQLGGRVHGGPVQVGGHPHGHHLAAGPQRLDQVGGRRDQDGGVRGQGHGRGFDALGQRRQQAVEHLHGPEVVGPHDGVDRPDVGPDTGARHQAVEAAPGLAGHPVDGGRPPRRRGQVGDDVGVVEIDPDHPGTGRLELAGRRRHRYRRPTR